MIFPIASFPFIWGYFPPFQITFTILEDLEEILLTIAPDTLFKPPSWGRHLSIAPQPLVGDCSFE